MLKRLKLTMLIVFILLFGAVFAACTDADDSEKLVLADSATIYSFILGEVDLSVIKFNVVDSDNKVKSEVKANIDMLTATEKAKLDELGTKPVTFRYNGMSIMVQITITTTTTNQIYQLTLDANGGYFVSDKAATRIYSTYSEQIPTNILASFPVVKRDGFVFIDWFRTPDFSGDPQRASSYTIDHDHTLYAKWQSQENRILSFTNGSYQTEIVKSVPYDGSLTIDFDAIAIEGHSFIGWKSDSDPTYYKKGDVINYVTKNAAFKAVYEKIKLTLTFSSDGRWSPIIKEVFYDDTFDISTLSVPDVESHNLVGWTVGGAAATFNNIKTNLNIVADYKIKTFTVRYFEAYPDSEKENLPKLISSQIVEWGAAITRPTVPIREGYNGSWLYELNGQAVSAEPIFSIQIKADYDIWSSYTLKVCTLTYYDNAGLEIKRESLDYNTVIVPINIDGYQDPKYWTVTWHYDKNRDGTRPWLQGDTIKENLSLYVKIVRNPYIVEFYLPDYDNEGNPITVTDKLILRRTDVMHDTIIKPPSMPDISGKYEIIGWTDVNGVPIALENSGEIKILDFKEKLADTDTAIYAVVAVKSYSVNIYAMNIVPEGGVYVYSAQLIETQTHKYGTVVTTDPVIDKSPYVPFYHPESSYGNFVFDGYFVADNLNGWIINQSLPGQRVNFASGFEVKGVSNIYMVWLDNEKGTPGIEYTLYSDDDGKDAYMVTGFEPHSNLNNSDIIIPKFHENDSHENIPVKSIAADAFKDAFAIKLNSIKLTASLQHIDEGAFIGVQVSFFELVEPSENLYVDDMGALYSLLNGSLIAYPIYRQDSSYAVKNVIGVDDTPVTRLARGCFATAINLTSIILNDNLVEIGDEAFSLCMYIQKIILPSSLTTIGSEAFAGCISLLTINCSENPSLRYVDYRAFTDTPWFTGCKGELILGTVLLKYLGNAESITVNSDVEYVAYAAFMPIEQQKLTIITFANNSKLKEIDSNAFLAITLKALYIYSSHDVIISPTAFDGMVNSSGAELFVNATKLTYYKGLAAITKAFKDANIKGV